ncbi:MULTISPECIES: peptidoglycan DD-metalloendopeptidase family protein [Paraburkholderia]|jgi:lipoprotein NlpD|uniref:LysM domain-containing protein n=1 Tax=Paraburkholderia aspalathi TaxID=1324617 RepID=A0ABM8R9Y9_9BURK|nr:MULTISPECIES: peptidoglycan DD-metalloendopeptidase family protein [Paraburkholderia]MCP2091043.1 lipoprotein NlpD [Paraburkholderia sediminicola]MBK3819019.1 peptidoglycan DD-metalloendopeptidase family protein [Paraburkholderia aspalathi]MBK3830900.1 peptidoglycan DD-metalloendopeptidase family protein [Paraburkholderia aspalathi]MBK3860574.1 peptidoglycan DD-metalloendopeptidase family protein [Paraburkholderia aspalathi]MCX4158755.1 peptidoglycan DD-metalloendopeptidase family protein [
MLGKRFDRTMMASLAGVWVALAVSGCANVGQQDAQTGAASGASAASGVPAAAAAPASGALAGSSVQSAADDGTPLKKSPPLVYRVKRGDTLARIAQHHHCSVRQLQAWNGLKPSSRLKLGQVLHVASPETVRAANAAAAAAKAAAVSAPAAPLAAQQAPAATTSQTTAQSATPSAAPSAAEAREVAQQTSRHANGVSLAWPAGGRVVEAFQPGETRGIEIGGKPGDPVRAAADGKVMYAGTGLNSYGSLIIVQHNKDFLTAYSHNRKLLVKIGDIVRQGQQIAEMGDENNSRVSVGFELRRDGKPVDPMPYLPQGRG